jgi:hypothetical protein
LMLDGLPSTIEDRHSPPTVCRLSRVHGEHRQVIAPKTHAQDRLNGCSNPYNERHAIKLT